MHRFDQIGNRLPLDVDPRDDVDQQSLFRRKRSFQSSQILRQTGEQNRLAFLTANRSSSQMRGDQSFLHQQDDCADQHEQQRHGSIRQWQTEKNHARANNDAQPDHRAHDLHHRAPLCFAKRRLIKTLRVQQDRTEYHDRNQQPGIITLWIDAFAQAEPESAVIPQGVSGP